MQNFNHASLELFCHVPGLDTGGWELPLGLQSALFLSFAIWVYEPDPTFLSNLVCASISHRASRKSCGMHGCLQVSFVVFLLLGEGTASLFDFMKPAAKEVQFLFLSVLKPL
jgi:hypothetical protein